MINTFYISPGYHPGFFILPDVKYSLHLKKTYEPHTPSEQIQKMGSPDVSLRDLCIPRDTYSRGSQLAGYR